MNWTELMIAIKKGLIPSKKELVDGTTKVGNADKLDGHDAEYFTPIDGSKAITGNLFRINKGKGVLYDDGSVMAVGGDDDTANARSLVINHPSYTADLKKAFRFRNKVNNTTNDYVALHEGNYSDYALPKSGGEVNGNVTVKAGDTSQRIHALQNSARRVFQTIGTSGNYNLYDGTNNKAIIVSTADGTNTFNGTASGNLPLTGGKIENSNPHALGVGNTSSDLVLPYYRGASGLLGYLGFNGENNPIYATKDGLLKPLLHTGNMADHVLPKSGGGIVAKNGTKVMGIHNTNSAYTLFEFYGNSTELGSIGFDGVNNMVFRPVEGGTKNILHTGNSAKVHIGSSAPSDTSALWVY